MKKIYSFLIVLLAFVSLQTKAQNVCSPLFTSQFLSSSTFKFNPVIIDSPAVIHYWRFGDGSPMTGQTSPTHTYTTSGVFNVCHFIFRYSPNGAPVCSDSICMPLTVQQTVCTLSASFVSTTVLPNTLTHAYVNTSSNFVVGDSIRWNFGDGTTSTVINPIHTYANAGVYNVCLWVKKPQTSATGTPCVSEVCHLDTVTVPNTSCTLLANFTYYRDSIITIPNSYHFTNTSAPLAASDSIRWTFGDGTFSNQVNPNHVYLTTGTFNVCLRVIKRNPNGVLTNCVSEKCYLVVVTPPIIPCNLQVYFTNISDSIQSNIIHFTNQSVGYASGDSITWTFGDGTTSNQINPVHTYANAGTYIVCIRVKKNNNVAGTVPCIREFCKTIVVTIPCNLLVTYTYYKDSSVNPAVYHFTNTTASLNATDSIRWSFGDGTFSNQLNPTHSYAQPGSYLACLKIIRRNSAGVLTSCFGEVCYLIVVSPTVTPCTLVANFIWYRDSLPTVALNTVHFTNTSVPFAATDSIRWTFGDGTSSNQINPLHVYAQPGTYTVCLRVIKRTASGALTNCVSEICKVVVVTQVCNVLANYTWQADSANYRKINFNNISIAPATATALWNFGDGTTATTWSTSHIYAQAGRYYVCLRVQYGTCISYKCDSITIVAPATVPTCNQLSLYNSIVTNNVVTFAPTFLQTNVQYTWTFGDGTGAQGANATHQYVNAGTYTACLTAFKNNTCASTTCRTITILPTVNCNNITLSINDTRDSLVPNRVTFTAISNTATTSQQWTITRVPTTAGTGTTTINTNNPTYLFLDSGYYNVCVKATYANGCIKTICKTIHILQPMPGVNTCTLQVYPNPATTVINASVTLVQPLIINASVYNNMALLVAQKIQQGVVGNNIVSVNIATLPSGVYTLRVVYGNQICYATFIK
jgi:PKD repeat protein